MSDRMQGPRSEGLGGARLKHLSTEDNLSLVNHGLTSIGYGLARIGDDTGKITMASSAEADGDVFHCPVPGVKGAVSETEARFLAGTYLHVPTLSNNVSASRVILAKSDIPVNHAGLNSVDSDAVPAGVDAQEHFSPQACVFVANLPEAETDEDLENEVKRKFSVFGSVWVKVRRDANNMPHAFAQFPKVEIAIRAVNEGNGIDILGRPCRTEMSRAQRSFAIYRRDGRDIMLKEAYDYARRFGEVDNADYMHEHIRIVLGYPNAIVLTFTKFRGHQNTMAITAVDPDYTVVKFDPNLFQNMALAARAQASNPTNAESERRTVYVGNLTATATEADMRILLNDAGEIRRVFMVRRYGHHGNLNHFSFVEFTTDNGADRAVQLYNGNIYRGHPLRVEAKNSRQNTQQSDQQTPHQARHTPGTTRRGTTRRQQTPTHFHKPGHLPSPTEFHKPGHMPSPEDHHPQTPTGGGSTALQRVNTPAPLTLRSVPSHPGSLAYANAAYAPAQHPQFAPMNAPFQQGPYNMVTPPPVSPAHMSGFHSAYANGQGQYGQFRQYNGAYNTVPAGMQPMNNMRGVPTQHMHTQQIPAQAQQMPAQDMLAQQMSTQQGPILPGALLPAPFQQGPYQQMPYPNMPFMHLSGHHIPAPPMGPVYGGMPALPAPPEAAGVAPQQAATTSPTPGAEAPQYRQVRNLVVNGTNPHL